MKDQLITEETYSISFSLTHKILTDWQKCANIN